MDATAKDGLDDDDAWRRLAASRLRQTLGGRWTLTEVLGVGGTACVYAATHRNGSRVAIKVLHPELSRNARLRRRFLSEGYAANRVGHAGAVVVLDEAEEADGTAFLVMELLQGQSLDRLLSARGKLPWREVAELSIGVLDVLAAAHDQHVLHRDLKPSNVFLTSAGQIKLLDFGTAKVKSWQGEHVITRSGTTLGTPAFMAPELASGSTDDVDALTDIWAVGATMFQLLTNRTVHVALNAQEAIVAAATRPAPRLRSLSEELPEAIAAIVDRALAYEKSERFPNARAMQAELRGLLGLAAAPTPLDQATTPEVEAVKVPRAAPSTLWRWGLLLGAALVLLALFARHRAPSAAQPSHAPEPSAANIAPIAPLPASNELQRAAAPGASASIDTSAPAPSAEVPRKPLPRATADAPKRPSPAGAPSAQPSSDSNDLLDRWR